MKNKLKQFGKVAKSATALLLSFSCLAGLASCDGGKTPPVTTPTPTTSSTAPVTDPPVEEKITYSATVYSSDLFTGSFPGPFEKTESTVYASVSLPEGFGGGYREFTAKNTGLSDRTGLLSIRAENIVGFSSATEVPAAEEDTLLAFFSALADTEYTVMENTSDRLSGGGTLLTCYTFSKEKNTGIYRAYSVLFSADGMNAVPFVFEFTGYTAFRADATREILCTVADSVRLSAEGFAIELADGLDTRSFSLYEALPDGFEVAEVRQYDDTHLAVFIKDAAGLLWVSFFGVQENRFVGEWIEVYRGAESCSVYNAQEGLIVSPVYGKYYTLTGAPGNAKVQKLNRAFADAIYSPDGEYRAHVQAATGSLVVECLSTGGSTVVYSPRTAQVLDAASRSVDPLCFTKDGSLIFRIDGQNEVVGIGVYNAVSGKTEEYKNGLTPIGCSASYLWCLNVIDGRTYEICRLPLTDLSSRETMYTDGGERQEGFFDNYEDIFFKSRITLNEDGSYFVFFPADDASRISLFSTRSFKCVYTTAVPNMETVFAMKKNILVATAGWGVIYTIDLPDRTTPGGSFDPDSVAKNPNYAPDYTELVRHVGFAAEYFYRPANGAASFSGTNIIYYLLNYAARNDMTGVYTEPKEPSAASSETNTPVTANTANVASSATTDTANAASEPDTDSSGRATVTIYQLKVLAWKLLGIEEEYFEDYILEPKDDAEELLSGSSETEAHENYYLGLSGEDFYDRETGVFVFTPEGDPKSGWSAQLGGAVVTQNANRMSVSLLLRGPDDVYLPAEYTVTAYEDGNGEPYFRLEAVALTEEGAENTLPPFELDGEKQTPLWFAVSKGSNRVYYPLYTSVEGTGGISRTPIDEKGEEYANDELLFGETYIFGSRALVSVTRNGVYDTALVEIQTGKTVLLSGKTGFAAYESEIAAMKKAGKSYPYCGARLLGASPGNLRVLLRVSDQVNAITGKYYVYDLSTGQQTPLSPSFSAKGAKASDAEYYQWMGSSRLRLAVRETVAGSAFAVTYEWSLVSGKWTAVRTEYVTDGETWSGSAGTGTATGSGTSGTTDPAGTTKSPDDTEEVLPEKYSNFTDISGAPSGVGMTLQQIAESFLDAKAKKIAATPGYNKITKSEYVITFRSDSFIIVYEYAMMLNADGEPTGSTANCRSICEYKNGTWNWTQVVLP